MTSRLTRLLVCLALALAWPAALLHVSAHLPPACAHGEALSLQPRGGEEGAPAAREHVPCALCAVLQVHASPPGAPVTVAALFRSSSPLVPPAADCRGELLDSSHAPRAPPAA